MDDRVVTPDLRSHVSLWQLFVWVTSVSVVCGLAQALIDHLRYVEAKDDSNPAGPDWSQPVFRVSHSDGICGARDWTAAVLFCDAMASRKVTTRGKVLCHRSALWGAGATSNLGYSRAG
jgi:hypothetical protein